MLECLMAISIVLHLGHTFRVTERLERMACDAGLLSLETCQIIEEVEEAEREIVDLIK